LKLWRPKTVGSRIVAALGLVATILAIVLGVMALIPDPKPPHLSVVFVLDVSPAMREHLGGTTRLSVAQDSILANIGAHPGISTSLRLVTAGCGAAYAPPTVGFSKHNAGRFRDVFSNLGVEQASTYFEGLSSASNDLATKELVQDSPEKLLVVFVADSSGKCGSSLPSIPIGGGLVVQYVWLGGSGVGLAAVRKQLEDLGFEDITVFRPESKNELKAAVARKVSAHVAPLPAPETTPQETSPADTSTEPGTTTDLLIVPDVTGRPQDEATEKLEGSGFVPNVILADVTDVNQDDIVRSQDPLRDTQAERDSTVTLTVGRFVMP
jgi:hypothetical protein